MTVTLSRATSAPISIHQLLDSVEQPLRNDGLMLSMLVKGGKLSSEQARAIQSRARGTDDKRLAMILIQNGYISKEDVVQSVTAYILDIVFATRQPDKFKLGELNPLISYGASPRASIALSFISKAYAFLNKRAYVIPEDVRNVSYDVLRHRIGLTYEAEAENISSEDIITKIINTIEVP